MIILQQLGAAERVAQKAAHMLDVDPHGWTLTLVSVCVVFCALLLLYRAYLIIGKAFTGQYKRKSKGGENDEQAAAIAIAIDRYFEQDAVHDIESGIITIKR